MNKSGISLIVLVVTIIVMIIIAGTIIFSLSNGNVISKGKEAAFMSNIKSIEEQLGVYIAEQSLNTLGDASLDNINANTYAEIKAMIGNLKEDDVKDLRIVKGKLTYIGSNLEEINSLKNTNISLDIPYVKDGMILWYDGIYNGGIGIHNDNTSANKSTWKDLIGSNNGTLSSFDYNTSNGWIGNGLKFDEKPNLVNFNLNIPNKHTVEFVVMSRRTGYNGVFSVATNMTKTYSTGPHLNQFLFYNTAVLPGSNYGVGSITYTKQSLFTMTFDGELLARNMYQNNTSKVVSYWGGQVSGDFSDYTSFLLGNGGWGSLNGEIHSVRVYNRVLTAAEITQNYEIDKIRYNLD